MIIPRYSQIKKLSRDQSLDVEDIRSLRKIEDNLRKASDVKVIRRIAKDQPEEDPKLVYLKNLRDKDFIDEEKASSYKLSRDLGDDSR